MTLILSLETSTAIPSLTLARLRRGALVLWWEWQGAPGMNLQSSLFSALQEGLSAMQGQASEIRTLLVGIGPGSFTGAKVGVGLVKTLALTTPECEVFSLPTWLGALPEELEPALPVAWTVPSTRNTAYCTIVQLNEEGELEVLVELADYPQTELAGLLAAQGHQGLLLREPATHLPVPAWEPPTGWTIAEVPAEHATRYLELFADLGSDWEPVDPLTLEPLYIRPPQATLTKRPRVFGPP